MLLMKVSFHLYKISDAQPTDVELSLHVRFQAPVDGRMMPAQTYFEILSKTYRANRRILTPREIGCARAHARIWETIVREGVPGLVFEEDITLNVKDVEVARRVIRNGNVSFVHFGVQPDPRYLGIWDTDVGLFRVEPNWRFYGAFAYYVTPPVASALLQFHARQPHVADAWEPFFASTTFIPYHYPLFVHPPTRGELEEDRLVSRNAPHHLRLALNQGFVRVRQVFTVLFRLASGYRLVDKSFRLKSRNRRP